MSSVPLCRRRFVALLGLAAGGTIVASEWDSMKGLYSGMQKFCSSFSNLPPDALKDGYTAFLASQKFTIPIAKILAPHSNCHGSVKNALPQRSLWANIVPTLAVADRLAKELGEKIHILSVYRSPEYNATCPGAAKQSQHLLNSAMDIQFRSSPKTVATLAGKFRDDGFFKGGIGLYNDFVHIDTRGHNANW